MRALRKDFWMEIRTSKARFISIFMIVALGVAFFSGIQASSPDMRLSGDAYYDEKNLMDIKVVGTLGLTDDDVAAVKKIDGVQDAEGAYSTDVMCGEGEKQKVLHVESVNETMNQITATEGKIPEKAGEIFLDYMFAESNGYQVGDQITLRQDGDSELLKTVDYTVCGIGESPLYISYNRGNTTLGSGEVNGFAYVLPENFDQEVYTQIYVQVHGADELISYTDAYENLIEKVQVKVEGISEERCQVRYDDVVGEANEKLADAKKELEDGRKEADEKLSDAKKELEDGEKELKDGKKQYKDGKKQLADAKSELEDGKSQIADAKKELEDGKAQIADAKSELESGKAQIASAKSELEAGKTQIASAKEELASGREQIASARSQIEAGWDEISQNQQVLDEGKAQLEAGKSELSDGEQQIADGKAALTQSQQELDDGKAQIQAGREQIAATREELNAQKESCQQGLAQIEEQEAQLSQGEEALAGARAQLEALRAQYEQAVASGEYEQEDLDAMAAEVAAYQEQVESQSAQLEASRGQIAAARSELEGGLSQVEGGLAQLEEKENELDQQETALPQAQAKIDAGWKEIETQEQKLESARAEIQEKEAQLAQAQEQIETAKEQLSSSEAQIEEKEAQLADGEAQIQANEAKIASGAQEIASNEAKIASGEQKIAANEQKLVDGEKEIAANEKKLADGEKEIAENEQKLKDARKDIKKAEKDLEDGWKEYEDGKADAEKEIADGEKKIADAQKEIDDIAEPEWIVTDRNDLPEYSDYGDNAERLKNIGQVFPVIFFLVAALVSLTTMTRMVEEQRTQIGTMKALGYGKYAIASKYLLYALLATVGGSILGILIGEKILPYIIINAYGIMYKSMTHNMQIHYEFKFAMIAAGAATVCTIGATIFSCYKALAETPASLMRPPAPKEGKRILVERISFFWKHLSFTWKSTLRNLFRYKKRLFMTVFGIAGSMALMLVGFGIRDSIMDIAQRQYRDLQHYTGTIIDDEDATEKEREELGTFLANNDQIDRYTHVQFTKMTVPRNKSNISVYVYVPENLENFKKDVTLQDRKTKEKYELTDEGAVISEKTASLTGLKAGDTMTITKDGKDYETKIAAVTENYMGHYIYMTGTVYEQTFGEKPDYSATVFTVKDEYQAEQDQVGNEILKYPAALSISYTSSLEAQLDRMLGSLGTVIVVLIISAGMLAFVVLYNLNNINITERQRELATLKVLGFYDKEVSAYVYRENIILTFIGVLAGAVFGIFLHRYIILTVEVDAVMFGRNIKPISFLYSGLLTVGFSMIVNLFMHQKLKKIDMVESLKSVE